MKTKDHPFIMLFVECFGPRSLRFIFPLLLDAPGAQFLRPPCAQRQRHRLEAASGEDDRAMSQSTERHLAGHVLVVWFQASDAFD